MFVNNDDNKFFYCVMCNNAVFINEELYKKHVKTKKHLLKMNKIDNELFKENV